MKRNHIFALTIATIFFTSSIVHFFDYKLDLSSKPTSQSFKLAVQPAAATIFSGSTQKFTLTITSLDNENSTISLTVSQMPSGVSATIYPGQLVLPANGVVTSTLTVIGWNAFMNPETLVIEAINSRSTQSANLAVRVLNPKNMTGVVHWSYDGFGQFTISDMVNKTLELGSRFSVVTLKDSEGNVYFGDHWNSNNGTKIDASLLVEQFHANGILVIGDVAGLYDGHWVAAHQDSGLFIWNQTIHDYNRSDSWLEPFYVYADIRGGRGYSQYVKDIINATLALGFDGVNFDDQLIYPYSEYTKPNCTFSGSPEFKEWANVTQSYSGHERYFAQWNETDNRFFNKRAEVIDEITEEWANYTKQTKPDAITTVYLNPKEHIAHGVRLSSYSQFFDVLFVQAYSNYVDYQSLSEIRANVSKTLYAFVYSIVGASYPPIFFNDENVMREIAKNAQQLKYEGIGVFTANKAFENELESLLKELFQNYASG